MRRYFFILFSMSLFIGIYSKNVYASCEAEFSAFKNACYSLYGSTFTYCSNMKDSAQPVDSEMKRAMIQGMEKEVRHYKSQPSSIARDFYLRQAEVALCWYKAREIQDVKQNDRIESLSEQPKKSDCETGKTELVNRGLQSIDQRIETYLQSNLGQEGGTITPSLQVVMWGTSQQANVIEKHCSGMMGFDTRVKELRAAFNSAQQACRQIQSNPSICEPVEPLKLIANYEQAQRISQAASTSTLSSTNSSEVSEKKATSSLPDTHCQGGNPKGVCIAR